MSELCLSIRLESKSLEVEYMAPRAH
jgi:hypothetical protein